MYRKHRHYGTDMMDASAPIAAGGDVLARPPARLAAAFAVVALALLLAGVFFYQTQERHQRSDAREALSAVSRLKVDHISRWREYRLSDAAVWSDDSYLAGPILRYLSAPTPTGQAVLRSGLLAWKQHKAYADAAVTDPRGNVVFSLSGETGLLPQDEAAALQEALNLHRPVLTELHREPGVSPHVSAVAPLFTAARGMQGMPTPAGALILQCDATIALYPLIISWPTASRTAETVLVRRDGDAMLFLNDARYNPHSAFEVRVPLARRNVPSVMAGAGLTGFVQGVDYLGVAVFADIRKIPGTAWFAITRVAQDEAMASWRASSLQIACLVAGLLDR